MAISSVQADALASIAEGYPQPHIGDGGRTDGLFDLWRPQTPGILRRRRHAQTTQRPAAVRGAGRQGLAGQLGDWTNSLSEQAALKHLYVVISLDPTGRGRWGPTGAKPPSTRSISPSTAASAQDASNHQKRVTSLRSTVPLPLRYGPQQQYIRAGTGTGWADSRWLHRCIQRAGRRPMRLAVAFEPR